ncbi:hypothetical protein [Kordiimonas sp.]|uniref:hypothetical protein n=1 Tax=Kordiimonas sp. TaxID=1970157 RepID=UPI003A93D5D5
MSEQKEIRVTLTDEQRQKLRDAIELGYRSSVVVEFEQVPTSGPPSELEFKK